MRPSLSVLFSAFILTAAHTFALPITVDPATPMTGSWAAEWNTAGDLEGWSGSGATVSVAGGLLSGTATTTDSRVQRANFAGGPDLDLGYNDFIELRIQVPAAYTGDIQIFYGTTTYTVANGTGGTVTAATTGFSSARVITIPGATIPDDGAFHTYRIDAGLEPAWRATLRDLRIDPVEGAGTSGMAFAIDYLRVGDEPGAVVYQSRSTAQCPAAGGTTPEGVLYGAGQTVLSMESKHFRFSWNAAVAAHGSWTADMAHGTLRNLEETWQVFANKLGYRQPNQAISNIAGTKYKLNVISWYDGYWAGVDTDFAHLNITPDGLRVDPPTWVIPHELMHCFQFHNTTGNVPGEWFEFHANYGNERYLQHYQIFYPNGSCIDPTHLRSAHLNIGSGREYYLCWPFFQYIDENPDALPDLGEGKGVALWQQTLANEYPFMTLERLTATTSLKDIVGYFARRGATHNYSSKTAVNASLASFGQPLDNAATARWQFTDLVQRPDDSTWWRVPYEMAPMQGAYAIHELVPAGSGAGRVVTVNLRGLADSTRGADWRASFIVISDSGAERYSTLWGGGNNSVTLAANENKVYLSVAGAPATFYYGGADEVAYPYRTHPSKTRFPYELQVTGATPKQRDNGGTSGLVQHSNGGGYKAVGAVVSVTAYIGPNARVLGGLVSDNARIEDYAVVSGGTVNTNAVISGHAWVRGGTVTGNAKVRDWALVEGGTVTGSARILEHGNFKGGTAQDLAVVKGTAATLSGTLSGNAIIDGEYGDFFSGRDLANAIAFGHEPYVGVPDRFTKALPTGLYAAYEFSAAHDSRILDNPGVTDGFTVGSPTWVSADAKRSGFLSFDGATQAVLLDRSVADLRDFTFTAWVKPLGGAANQAVLWLGATSTKRLTFTPDDGAGHAKFGIVNGGAEQTLTAASALPTGVWSHVAVTLNGTTGTLYINGVSAASGGITIRPDQILAANTATALQHNYLARSEGALKPKFRGALDDVRFYGAALSAGDIAAMQPATSPVASGTLYVDLRASDASAGTATWINNGTIGNFTVTGSPTKVANVLSTGIPAVQFSGNSQAYTGPNTVADIDGADDRSIEVWAYNPALATEETTVSWGHRGTDSRSMAFNFGSHATWGAATHWGAADVGWGTAPTANAWHHLVYTYDGATTVKVYIDGVLANTKTLTAALNTFPGEPINIACQRDTANGTRSLYYSGYINTVRIHGGVLTPAQVASNQSLGPVGAPANAAPTISNIADQATVVDTATGAIAFTVGDAATAAAALTASGGSSNPTLVPAANIVFGGSGTSRTVTVTPAAGQTGTATITVTVSDGALTANDTFVLTVNTVNSPPVITSAGSASGVLGTAFSYQITATNGPTSYGASGLPAGLGVNTGSGLIDGTPTESGTFNATVSATNAAGTGNAPLTITIQVPLPPAPTGLSAIPGETQVALSWTASGGATSYNVKRATVSGGPYTAVATGVTGTGYTDTGVSDGTTYYYVVSAVNEAGEGTQSAELRVSTLGTVAFWDFEDGVAGQAFTPAGNANGSGGSLDTDTGILMRGWNSTGGPGYTSAVAPNGDSLAMSNADNHQDGYVTEGALHGWSPTAWTIECTVYLEEIAGWETLIGRDGSSQSEAESDFYLANNGINDKFRVNIDTVGGQRWVLDGNYTVQINTWYALAVMSNGATLSLWLDNGTGYQQIGSLDISAQSVAQNALPGSNFTWTFGRGWFNGGFVDHIDGRMDNIRFSNGARAPADLIPLVPAPPAPTGLSATTASDTQINLSWTASAGATSYNVKRATVSGGPYTTIASGVTGTSYNDTGLTGSTTYYYVVSAVNTTGEGTNSTETSATTQAPPTPPAAPTGLNATAASDTEIDLSWTASAGANSYNVKRATTSGGPYTTLATGVAGTTYGDTDLTASTAYHYVVSAVNPVGEGADSTQASATTQAPAPTAPTGLSATTSSATEIDLSWTASAGATSYNVKRATVSGGPYTTIATGVTATDYGDTGLAGSTTYHYVVSAENTTGESADSTEDAATTWTPVQAWRQTHFGTTENAGDAADGADPEGDGVVNQLERAFGGNPNAADQNVLPSIDSTAPLLSIIYRKAVAASDLVFTVRESTDLVSWPIATGTSEVLSDGPVQVIRFTRPAGSDNRLFLRLQVTGP